MAKSIEDQEHKTDSVVETGAMRERIEGKDRCFAHAKDPQIPSNIDSISFKDANKIRFTALYRTMQRDVLENI